MDDPERA